MDNYFKGFTVEYIKRSKNSEADELAKATARNMPLSANVFFQVLPDASIKTIEVEPRVINLIDDEDWHTPIMVYLSQTAPQNTSECSRELRRTK
jgi:hypothetical protein